MDSKQDFSTQAFISFSILQLATNYILELRQSFKLIFEFTHREFGLNFNPFGPISQKMGRKGFFAHQNWTPYYY